MIPSSSSDVLDASSEMAEAIEMGIGYNIPKRWTGMRGP
jgi:hypothetical protein